MKEKAFSSLMQFVEWQKRNGFSSYDQYDFWSTGYGIWCKRLYYKNKYLGMPFVTPIFLADIILPGSRRFFAKKKRFPIADAHFILGYLNLYLYTSGERYLQEAKNIADALLESSLSGFSGHCWGYPFNWMTTRGLWKSGVPLITTTGYCFEAYMKLFELTKEERYLTIAHSIFNFSYKDLKDTPVDKDASSCSYSPIDNSQIINANAYRSYVLVKGSQLFTNKSALEKALSNIRFILSKQQSDGSWLYAVNDNRDHFIDNFHTCFVLKNLLKVNRLLNDDKIALVVKKGFDFYKKSLLSSDMSPVPFAKLSRINIVKKELYDYAEGISLCLEMQDVDADAQNIANMLVQDVVSKYQKKDGSYTTRVNIFNIRNNVPFLRWPQAQLFFALTKFILNNHN